jgi:hypothetical protein
LRKADRGSGPVEFAVLAFPLLLLTFMVVQAAFVFYARSTALAAATQGANAARAYNAPLSSGTAKASDFLTRTGGGLGPEGVHLLQWNRVTVTVTGEAQTVIPFVRFPGARAPAPIEGSRQSLVGGATPARRASSSRTHPSRDRVLRGGGHRRPDHVGAAGRGLRGARRRAHREPGLAHLARVRALSAATASARARHHMRSVPITVDTTGLRPLGAAAPVRA